MAKIIVRLAGGLGNQLFQYAAARRLAHVNAVPLYLDAISGYERDGFGRSYSLGHFNICAELASPAECYAGSTRRVVRYLLRKWDANRPLPRRKFISEPSGSVGDAILSLRVSRTVYLEGYWQSDKYFNDIADLLRDELGVVSPLSPEVADMARRIEQTEATVCIHVRHLYHLGTTDNERQNEVNVGYYRKAMADVMDKVGKPHFFVFSDDAIWAEREFASELLSGCTWTVVDREVCAKDYEVLHLMSRCRHFVTSFSTFSWWGAWLSSFEDKIVIAPSKGFSNTTDMMPKSWIVI